MANRKLSKSDEGDIVTLYRDGTAIAEVKQTYELSDSRLYGILKRNHVPTRAQGRAAAKDFDSHVAKLNASEEVPALDVTGPLTITTDAQGFVQQIDRKPANVKTYTWEVRFESAMRVEAATIVEAISEVQKLPMCRRVFNVALKGAP